MMAGNHKTVSNNRKAAFSLQLPYNFYKLGIGARFAYDFTDALRFTLDGDYYYYNNPARRFHTINSAGETGTMGWGKIWDVNPNLNFVYGENDFHFYLIFGIYFSYGYKESANTIVNILEDGGNAEEINHETYYYKDKLISSVGVGLNGGCGIEFQVSDSFRWFFEQHLSLGLMTSWMAKLGISYCF